MAGKRALWCGGLLTVARRGLGASIALLLLTSTVAGSLAAPGVVSGGLLGEETMAVSSALPPPSAYDIGQPVLLDLYVSPTGNDANHGRSAAAPLRTLTAAWGQVPAHTSSTNTGYRINLLPGAYACEPSEPDDCQNHYEDRRGTYQYPIIMRAYNGPGTVTVRGGLDLTRMSYLHLIDLNLAGGTPLPTNNSGNNLLHLADVDHVLLRNVTLAGPACPNDGCNNLQEVLKVNQAQYLYVERCNIGGAWHTAVDYFSVQYGHFLNNHVHTVGQWGMYVKGGTAYLRVEGNEFHHCQLGFQAGQSSNLAVMRAPWVHYEAYDVKFVNNVLHDIAGTGLSVSGGYNILFAHNTLYRVGTSQDPGYPLVQALQGERGCSATDELPTPLTRCRELTDQGAWGPRVVTDNLPAVPNRNVYVYNNLFYNPAPAQTLYEHLTIYGPIALPAGFVNLPSTVASDQNLVIRGNLIWNGPADHPLGLWDESGCRPSNPTCNATQLVAQNSINALQPQLVRPGSGNYHPVAGGNVFWVTTYAVPNFGWQAFTPSVPAGTAANTVAFDRDGAVRLTSGPPGAYCTNGTPTNGIYLPMLRRPRA